MKLKKINKILKFWQIRSFIILFILSTMLVLFLDQEKKANVIISFMLMLVGCTIYAYRKFYYISKYLRDYHNSFYQKNKFYLRFWFFNKSLNYVEIPIFGFIKSIKTLEDSYILDQVIDFKITTNCMFFMFVTTIFLALLTVLMA